MLAREGRRALWLSASIASKRCSIWLFVSAEGPETAMSANLGTLMALGALAPLTLKVGFER